MTVDDLHDTEGCPVGTFCESCGSTGPKLTAVTATTPVGVFCLTLCGRCGSSGLAPRITPGTAAIFVATHCAHLGISVDEMARVLAGEDR